MVAFLTTSCTEIIELNINSSDPQLVVEGGIGQDEFAEVILTKSINMDADNTFPAVENAVVTIKSQEGETEILTETKPGIYQSMILKGKAGMEYFLTIDALQNSITSESLIPTKVAIDSFNVVNSIYPGGGAPIGSMPAYFYEITVGYNDPVDESNYYRFLIYVNGVFQSSNRIFSDKFNNGNKITSNLIIYDEEIKKGDTIRTEMQCINKKVYDYFESMNNGRMGGSSTPSNPYTNLNGGVLGYFSAYTVERREYVVK